jgi:hypothetical protein
MIDRQRTEFDMSLATDQASHAGTLAEEIYQTKIRPIVEPTHVGEIVSIDVTSGDYELGLTVTEAVDRLACRQPYGDFYSFRVGYDAVAGIRRAPRRVSSL